MSVACKVLEIPLPEGVEPTEEELAFMKASLAAILALPYERDHSFEAVRRKLEADGWTVSVSLGWCAEARRGRDHERALGRNRDEVFSELYQLTRFDREIDGLP